MEQLKAKLEELLQRGQQLVQAREQALEQVKQLEMEILRTQGAIQMLQELLKTSE